jgi:hypothetical protein
MDSGRPLVRVLRKPAFPSARYSMAGGQDARKLNRCGCPEARRGGGQPTPGLAPVASGKCAARPMGASAPGPPAPPTFRYRHAGNLGTITEVETDEAEVRGRQNDRSIG